MVRERRGDRQRRGPVERAYTQCSAICRIDQSSEKCTSAVESVVESAVESAVMESAVESLKWRVQWGVQWTSSAGAV